MKAYLLAGTALAVVTAVNLSPAMANRLGPFDTRVTDYSDLMGQDGVNAATTTPDGLLTGAAMPSTPARHSPSVTA